MAIKVAPSLHAEDIIRLKREFRLLAHIRHPNLIRFYDLHVTPRHCFFTMELIKGRPFCEAVRSGTESPQGQIDFDRLRGMARQLCAGLQALHSHGILHRDLKPANLLVEAGGRTVILDFGLARRVSRALPRNATETDISGTFAYMAPEILAGGEPGPASDWYSIGVVLYECLTGRLPEVVADPAPRSPKSLAAVTPADLENFTLALLSADPGTRLRAVTKASL